jgi:hypothetical protein
MTKGDLLVERGADRLHDLARRAAARGDGVGEWLAEELTADAAFLRKLKPSLVAARVRAERTNGHMPPPPPAEPVPAPPPTATRAAKPKPSKPKGRGGVSPWLVVGAALVTGIVVAKVVDWRGHAHPRG